MINHDNLHEFLLGNRKELNYAPEPCISLMGEDEDGNLFGPALVWEEFDPSNQRHIDAAIRTRDTGLIVALEEDHDE